MGRQAAAAVSGLNTYDCRHLPASGLHGRANCDKMPTTLGRRQVERQWPLEPLFAGSNPAAPAARMLEVTRWVTSLCVIGQQRA